MLSFAFCFVVDVACSVAKTRLCSYLDIQNLCFRSTPKNVTRNSPSPSLPHLLLLFILYHTFIVSGFWTEEKEKRSKPLFFQWTQYSVTRTLLLPAWILSLDDLGFRLEDLRLDRESRIQGLFALLNLRFSGARLCF